MRVTGLEQNQASWTIRWAYIAMRRQFGRVLTPFKVMARRPRVAIGAQIANLCLETSKATPTSLKRLVCLRAAQIIGCPF